MLFGAYCRHCDAPLYESPSGTVMPKNEDGKLYILIQCYDCGGANFCSVLVYTGKKLKTGRDRYRSNDERSARNKSPTLRTEEEYKKLLSIGARIRQLEHERALLDGRIFQRKFQEDPTDREVREKLEMREQLDREEIRLKQELVELRWPRQIEGSITVLWPSVQAQLDATRFSVAALRPLNEAHKCFARGIYEAIPNFCKKALFILLKSSHIYDINGLVEKLPFLRETGAIDQQILDWAMSLISDKVLTQDPRRTPVTKREAQDVMDFTTTIVHRLTIGADKYQQYKKRRDNLRARQSKARK